MNTTQFHFKAGSHDAQKLLDYCEKISLKILTSRVDERNKIINDNRRKVGSRFGFLWLEKKEVDETDEEVIGRILEDEELEFNWDMAKTRCEYQYNLCQYILQVLPATDVSVGLDDWKNYLWETFYNES